MKARDLEFSICPVSEVRDFIELNHYSRSINGVKVTVCFKAEYIGEMVGAMLFGQMSTTAWKKFGDTESSVLELRRLVLTDDCPKNSESRFVGHSLRYIKKNIQTVIDHRKLCRPELRTHWRDL